LDVKLKSLEGVQTRQLGEQERMLHEMHRFGGLIAAQVLHIRGPLDASLVRRALDWLQQRHPILRAHVTRGKLAFRDRFPFVVVQPSFQIEGTSAIPFTEVDDPDWEKVLREEMRTPIPLGTNPRIRAVLIKPVDGVHRLIVTADHSVTDAQAAALHSREILEFLEDPLRPPLGLTGLPPSLEEVYTKPDSKTKAYEPSIRLPHKMQKGVPRESRSVARAFTKEETAAIYAALRPKRATMHGTVAAAMLEAAHAQYGLKEMTFVSTWEFRRMAKPPLPADTYGSYIDLVRTKHEIGGDFWALAKDVAFKLIGTVAKDQKIASILELPTWSWYRHELLPSLRTGMRLDGMGLTTAGDTGLLPRYGDFELVDITMSVSVDLLGCGIFVVSVERDGCLSLLFLYSSQTLPEDEVVAIADHTANRLRNLPA
jgi:hypothetical protein